MLDADSVSAQEQHRVGINVASRTDTVPPLWVRSLCDIALRDDASDRFGLAFDNAGTANASDGIEANTEALGEFRLRVTKRTIAIAVHLSLG